MSSRLLRRLSVALALLASTGYATLASAHTITVVTEELPPYNMTVDGKLTGMATEIVEATLAEAGVQATIRAMPWARAYDLALHGENVLIYSIARTPEREALFKWVGPFFEMKMHLFSLPGTDYHLKTLDDARQYQIATVKDDVGEQYLIAHGFAIGKNLQSSNKYEHNYAKLKEGRVQLWISNDLNAHWLVRQGTGDPEQRAVPQLAVDLGGQRNSLGMAFSRQTDDVLVQRMSQALERVRADGRYEAIMRRWQ
ncbi:substrate-binding periplasmic protein [Stutzerimonas chloritidismutans]|uniref:substrate-binding periplasmic protein n=1 Tax=Stutzerimonas chloritidismutans TaxID=203192 RepID=UPI003F18613C